MARKPKEGQQREQYARLMMLSRFAAETGYLESYLPQERKEPTDRWLEEQLPILVGVAQQTITLPLMTIEQASAWLGMNLRTVRWHVLTKKDLPSYKPGGKMLLLKIEDLKEFKRVRREESGKR